ncbi:unnamed protein product [Anisakis simplex]|uniref:G_PROTEIN_RECEP_F1_2 domain-containing protein n=1 Tax=Anisakis simplex TaxID=6269 RepID=A0A0M3K9A9_ANISI|nr:unnamed protein product [Anisakis simplex]
MQEDDYEGLEQDDLQCFSVQENTFEYEAFDWENFTADDCNCSQPLHSYLGVCEGICEPVKAEFPPFTEVALPAALYLMVFMIGTIGNALVIFVVNRFKRMRNVTNIFLASLSTADLCLIWFCVPIMVGSVRSLSLNISCSNLSSFAY